MRHGIITAEPPLTVILSGLKITAPLGPCLITVDLLKLAFLLHVDHILKFTIRESLHILLKGLEVFHLIASFSRLFDSHQCPILGD